MIGMNILSQLLGRPRPTHQPLGADRNSVMDVVRRMDIERLPAGDDPTLSQAISRAISQGRDIRQIGCSPHGIRSDAEGHEVDMQMRLEGEGFQRMITMRISPALHPVSAVQTATRSIDRRQA